MADIVPTMAEQDAPANDKSQQDDQPTSDCTVFQNPKHYTIKHPLRHSWTLWYDIPVTKVNEKDWMAGLKQIYTFKYVEDFWAVYNNIVKVSELSQGGNFHFFKEGVKPMWEDPANKEGGKWLIMTATAKKKELDSMWLNTMLACIGEVFDEFEGEEEICGCVCSPRRYKNKLALWTKSCQKEEAQTSIGKKWKEICEYTEGLIGYQAHNATSKKPSNAIDADMYKV